MKNLYLLIAFFCTGSIYTSAQDPCDYENPIQELSWLADAAVNIAYSTNASPGFCTGGNIAQYNYNGQVVFWVQYDCLDQPAYIYNCEGSVICFVGGETLPEDQCDDFNEAEFIDLLWTYGDDCPCDDVYEPVCIEGVFEFENACVAECAGYNSWMEGECESTAENCGVENPLEELDWLVDLTSGTSCCGTNQVEQLTDVNGNTYFYAMPNFGSATCPTDMPSFIFDCEGETICTFSFIGTPQECIDLLNSSESELIWDCTTGPIGGNDCGIENPLEELEWLAQQQESLISIVDGSPILCTGALISEYVYNGETVFWVEAFCLDSGASIYDCEGNFICYVGGLLPPEEQCLDFFDNAELIEELWSYEGCNCGFIYEPVCADGITFDNPCFAECEGFLDWIPGECNEECNDLTISAFQGCGGDCGCDNLLELSASGGDGNFTFTLPDGQVVTDGFNAFDINSWEDVLEVTATDGAGCTISTFMDVPLLCCDAPPCAEIYEITTECNEENVNCILVINLNPNNDCLIELLDQDGNAYTAGQELDDGDYTFTAYIEGGAGNECEALGTYQITVENPFIDALEDLSVLDANIYPNPTEGLFQLDIDGNWDVQIYSITGELITTQKNDYQFDLSKASKGLYFVKIMNEQASFIARLIVQ